MNKNIINSDQQKSGNSSNVSTYRKEEKQAYVRRYVMPEGRRRVWLENNRSGDEIDILFPTKRMALKEDIETPERREKAKHLITALAIAAILLIAWVLFSVFGARLVIKEIKVEGNSRYTAEEIISASGFTLDSKMPIFGRDKTSASLLAEYPYLKSCDITLDFPNTVTLSVTEEKAAVYTEIFGEYYALSSKLRILERSESKEEFAGMIYIEIPRAELAVVGDKLVLAEKADSSYITDFLELAAESSLDGRIDLVYFDEKYDIIASVDEKYRILFGAPADMALKIETAAHIIGQNEENCTSGSVVDVRVVDIAGIVINAGIDPGKRE